MGHNSPDTSPVNHTLHDPDFMALDNILLFDPQCCDAVEYLDMGLRCAADGNCYDTLRPLGIVYWFSLPYRLGIAPEWLIVLQVALLLLSALLGALAMRQWLQRRTPATHTLPALLLFSLLAHVVWFYPLLQLSLSDMPASLMALIGIWLLCLSQHRLGWQCLAGLCLGIACSLRTFFLYPLFGMLSLWLLLALIPLLIQRQSDDRRRTLRITLLAILSALIPIGLQYSATLQQSGMLSYLDNSWASHWSSRHLDDNASGYDTVSFAPYRWYRSPCQDATQETAKSVALSVAERDPSALACLVLGRLYFYFGSYSSKVFHYGEHDNLLPPPPLANTVPLSSTWQRHGLQERAIENDDNNTRLLLDFLTHCEQMPVPDQICRSSSLSDAVITLEAPTGQGYLEASLSLPAEQTITFSAVLMAQDAVPVTLSVIDAHHQVIASQSSYVGREPTFIAVTGIPPTAAVYRLRISLDSAETNHQSVLTLWAIRAEQGGAPVALEKTSLSEANIRHWSPWLLAINTFMLAIALIAAWRWRTTLCPAEWSALFFLVLSMALSVIIVPEQRFFIAPMVALWTLASVGIIDYRTIVRTSKP